MSGDTSLRRAPVYLVFDGEMLLDAGVQDAWPRVIDYPSWQNYSTVQHVCGNPGQEGEVILLKKNEGGVEFPAYCARTVKLEQGRRIIWKTFPAEKADGDDSFGIVEFMLEDVQGKTRFRYHTLYEFQVSYRDESELQAFRARQKENIEAVFAAVFPKLKRLVAGRAG